MARLSTTTQSRPRLLAALAGAMLLLPVSAFAQGKFPIGDEDIVRLKPMHYYGQDKAYRPAQFEWKFTPDGFTLKQGKGPIPDELMIQFMSLDKSPEFDKAPPALTGKWKLEEGKLILHDIKAGDKELAVEVELSIYKTAPTVVRMGYEAPQFVFSLLD